MAKHSPQLLELARRGAELRYEELKAEMESLARRFPHVRRPGFLAAPVENVRRAIRRRRRQKWSAEARKAVSDRMKKYWAARRTGKKR